MRNKKLLKGTEEKNRVFIECFLPPTPLRGKILREVRMDPEVKGAWTTDGNICCIVKENN